MRYICVVLCLVLTVTGLDDARAADPWEPSAWYKTHVFQLDPLPWNSYIIQEFMQLNDNEDVTNVDGRLHRGVDVDNATGAAVSAPVVPEQQAWVSNVGTDFIVLYPSAYQGLDIPTLTLLHLTPSVIINTPVASMQQIGVLDDKSHLHIELRLADRVLALGEWDKYLVNPRREGFALALWNQDHDAPVVDATIVSETQDSVRFDVRAHDASPLHPSWLNGIYKAVLFIDGVGVDSVVFRRMRGKSGAVSFSTKDYYACVDVGCYPAPDAPNNPNTLRYLLRWAKTAGNHTWRIDVADAVGNVRHGEAVDGLPSKALPGIALAIGIDERMAQVEWCLGREKCDSLGISAFEILVSASRQGQYTLSDKLPVADSSKYEAKVVVPVEWERLWLMVVGRGSGGVHVLADTSVTREPSRPALGIYPNPSSGRTDICLVRDTHAEIDVSVFDVAGRRMKRLHRGSVARGTSIWRWDGRDDYGGPVPTGVYVVRARTLAGVDLHIRKWILRR